MIGGWSPRIAPLFRLEVLSSKRTDTVLHLARQCLDQAAFGGQTEHDVGTESQKLVS